MKTYKRNWQQMIYAPLKEVWPFFATPKNLNNITPDNMKIDIISKGADVEIFPGMTIEYRMKPLPWFKTRWITEITEVKHQQYFIDIQKKGPFKSWHHEHHFEEVDEGVLMTDVVKYRLPLGIIGDIANSWVVNRRLDDIFDHRKNIIHEVFSSPNPSQ